MVTNFDYANDIGKQGARMMANRANRHKKIFIEDRQAMNSYFNTFQMYCENDVIERLRRLQNKLANKEMMFKFDGNRYAIFSLHIDDGTPITDYKLTLEQVEDFAENV